MSSAPMLRACWAGVGGTTLPSSRTCPCTAPCSPLTSAPPITDWPRGHSAEPYPSERDQFLFCLKCYVTLAILAEMCLLQSVVTGRYSFSCCNKMCLSDVFCDLLVVCVNGNIMTVFSLQFLQFSVHDQCQKLVEFVAERDVEHCVYKSSLYL